MYKNIPYNLRFPFPVHGQSLWVGVVVDHQVMTICIDGSTENIKYVVINKQYGNSR